MIGVFADITYVLKLFLKTKSAQYIAVIILSSYYDVDKFRALNLLCALCVRSRIGMSEIVMLMSETCFQVDRQIYKM